MAPKDKKRKASRPVSIQPVAPAAEPAEESVAVAVAEPEPAPKAKEASDSKKVKSAKPAPVLTKKPSRLRFFVDAALELKKAHWPTRREALRLSLLVGVVCVVVGAVLGGIDFVFLKLMGLLLLGG